MPGFVTIRYRRQLPVPVDAAFEWLTDYQDDDPDRTDAVVVDRPVLERTADRVRLKGTVDILGNRSTGVTEVDLLPPNRWRARILEGPGRGSVYEYRLDATANGTSKLAVDYKLRVRRLRSRIKLLLARRMIHRELDRMWDGFVATMTEELSPVQTT